MAFTPKSFTQAHGYPVDSDARFSIWKYRSLADTMNTILTVGYFDTYIDEMSVGDLIYFISTDGYGTLRVTSVTGNVAVSMYSGSGSVSVTVSSAELLALAAAPKTIIPAPGATQYIRFLRAELTLDFNAAAYVITNAGDDLAFRYTDGAGAICSQTLQAQGFLDETEDAFLFGEAIDEIGGEVSDLLNQPVVLDNIGAAEYTTGDSPVYVEAHYEVKSLPF